MKKVKITGVPEHFNFPWHLAIEEGAFRQRGIDLQWMDIPEGTGRMSRMLQEGESDLAVILTEGIIKSITEGSAAKIVQEYIASPLLWGIHVGAGSSYQKVPELRNTRAAISRHGSGSHLMAYVLAREEGWGHDAVAFEVVHSLEGAIAALTEGTADYFMWEHFTTKPWVDHGIFRRLGDCPTPWPCFVIAANAAFLAANDGTLSHILEVINLFTGEFREIPSIDRALANRYEQKLEDIREWLSMTRWSQSQITPQTIDNVINTLYYLKLVDKKLTLPELVYNSNIHP
ncbi:MAG TPA: substrate-binding domain-containing protein [Eudoraea sp.]|nr:substrate-binding domain-containing protein [Eudoraea sp.]